MVRTFLVVMAISMVGLVGCGASPEERKADADAQISEEKVKIIQQYTECLAKYEGQKDVSEKCAHYKEASEAFIQKSE
ncbi:hypothetical protein [uncultured Nitrospira sp.]|uniref:hypothetical protein n=1 Tax=uncultured Nitrospira sp. TaxID=157176 RepID=UPI00314016B7